MKLDLMKSEYSDYAPQETPVTGRKVLLIVLAFFGVVIAANMTLLYFAVSNFSGLVVKNVEIRGAGDKGLSAGENSDVEVETLSVYDSEIAVASKDLSRIEMHLVSLKNQSVRIAGKEVVFDAREHVVTEYSHKFSREQFAKLASEAGFRVVKVWTDPEELFSVQYLECS